jgi:pSer/pThr/pTyr-binding forkhead associated (FHA) protein
VFESAGQAVVEDLSSWGTFVNGERVAGRAVLAAGDRVRVGSPGIELVLIASGGD